MNVYLSVGIALTLGLFAAVASRRARTPQVVGYIVLGIFLGSSVMNVIPEPLVIKMEIVSNVALALIGFSIGGELRYSELKELGKSIVTITALESSAACLLVGAAVFLVTDSVPLALVFGALASATAPAATVDVLWEYKSKGPVTKTLFAVVGMDDAAALIIYAFMSALAKALLSGRGGADMMGTLLAPFLAILGSAALGIVAGLAVHEIAKRTRREDYLLFMGLGTILICTGLAMRFHLSLILTNMFVGLTLINRSSANRKVFEAIAKITPPILLIFFVLVGARVKLSLIPGLGLIGIVYVVMRVVGKSAGAYAGARISHAPETVRKYLGFGLLSQAGVAIGLAIEASHTFAAYGKEGAAVGSMVITVIATTTFIYQIMGPPMTRYAIIKAGEVPDEMLPKKRAVRKRAP